MYYHVHIYQKHNCHEIKANLTEEELESRIVNPYQEGEPIVINGKTIQLNLIERIQIFKTITVLDEIVKGFQKEYDRDTSTFKMFGLSPTVKAMETGIDVSDEFITGAAGNKSKFKLPTSQKIFISHSSQNQNYGNALVELLTGVGVKDEEIIFTSNDAYGIPIGQSIFDWLKSRISEKPHVLYLLSPEYYKSVACLNEMGAAWVVESKHTMIFTPEFNLSSTEFLNGSINPREIGFFIYNHDKLIEFIESLRMDFGISFNHVLINQKIRLFLKNIKTFKSIAVSSQGFPPVLSNEVSLKALESVTPKQTIQVKPIVNKAQANSGKSRLLMDLESNKLKDEDVLLIHYIIETGRFKLGTGWRTGQEIENIKVWEEVQELNHSLSTNYDNALRRFEMKDVTEVSQTTGHGNPREISIKEEIKNELLNMSDELLSKIDEVFQRNKNTSTW